MSPKKGEQVNYHHHFVNIFRRKISGRNQMTSIQFFLRFHEYIPHRSKPFQDLGIWGTSQKFIPSKYRSYLPIWTQLEKIFHKSVPQGTLLAPYFPTFIWVTISLEERIQLLSVLQMILYSAMTMAGLMWQQNLNKTRTKLKHGLIIDKFQRNLLLSFQELWMLSTIWKL